MSRLPTSGNVGKLWNLVPAGAMGSIALGIGEDLRKRIDEAPLLFTGAAALLESDEVHPPVEQATVVRQLVLDFARELAPRAQFIDVDVVDSLDELGVEHLIDSAA